MKCLMKKIDNLEEAVKKQTSISLENREMIKGFQRLLHFFFRIGFSVLNIKF